MVPEWRAQMTLALRNFEHPIGFWPAALRMGRPRGDYLDAWPTEFPAWAGVVLAGSPEVLRAIEKLPPDGIEGAKWASGYTTLNLLASERGPRPTYRIEDSADEDDDDAFAPQLVPGMSRVTVSGYTKAQLQQFLTSQIRQPVRADIGADKAKLVDFAMVVLEQLRLNPRAFVNHEAHVVELNGWLAPHNGLERGEPVAPDEVFAYLKANLPTISQELVDTFCPPAFVSLRDRAFGALRAFKLHTRNLLVYCARYQMSGDSS